MTLVGRTLADLRRGLIGWAIGIAATSWALLAFWPSIQDMPDMDQFLANYPEAMRELFNLTGFGTPAGFLNSELFSFMPLLFVIFAISRGARLLAGEEEDGTLEVPMALGVPRWQLLAGKAAALALAVAGLGLVLLASLYLGAQVVGMDIDIGDLAAPSASMVAFGIEFGLLALAVGAATGSRGLAIAASSVAAVAAYLLYAMSRIVDGLEGWDVLSPIQHALRDGPVGTGWSPGYLAAMLLAGLAVLTLSVPPLTRRDIG